MTRLGSYLEARVTAGNFILGLMVLVLGYEYFTSRYLSRFPDYRLSYLIGAVTVVYFLALRFIDYNKRREMSTLESAVTSALDLLAALGVVGLALEYGNYPVAFLLNVDPSLYSFAPPGSISVYVLTAAFAVFIAPRTATHFLLPPAPQPKIASPAPFVIRAGSFEELVAALEQKTNELRDGAGPEGAVVDPRNVRLLLRLARVVEGLHQLWQALELEGRELRELPPAAGWQGVFRRERGSEWKGLIVVGPEAAAPPEKEALTEVLVGNPWASVLSKRALRGSRKEN
ncbi:MAG: hypothetical protein LYZ69_07060 [Nitrososphaerales archaeon]|nr:hypothetical protein [Nitrososphaerales archaeon]